MTRDPDSERYDYESAAALRKHGWLVVDASTLAWLERKPCSRPNCLTLVPLDRDVCGFCGRAA